MDHAAGAGSQRANRVDFDRRVRLEFRGTQLSSNGGLLVMRALDDALGLKVLFGMALRQTTGFVESLLRQIGLDWAVPDVSALSRRQKTLKVNIPDCGSGGPLHLPVDIEPVSATGSSEPARGHQGRGRREMERPQAWWSEAPLATVSRTGGETMARLAQDPDRDRREILGNPGGRVHHRRQR